MELEDEYFDCKYKNICDWYKPDCYEQSCWRSVTINGMLKSETIKLIKEGKLEIIIRKVKGGKENEY